MKLSENRTAGHLTALLTILIWGTTFISTKVLLDDFEPFDILLLRFAIGYLALLAVHPRMIPFRRVKEELLFAGAGLCGVTLYFLLENVALTYTLASNVGIIVSVAPFVTAVTSRLILKEGRLDRLFFAGFAVAMSGVVLLTLEGSSVLKLNPLGDSLAALACVFWGIYSILTRKISQLGYDTIGCTRRIFFYGLLFMLPVLFTGGLPGNIERLSDAANLANLLFLGLGASALCFVTWNWSVGVLGPVQTSVYIYLVPAITVAAAASILHEKITGAALWGALLTIAGLVLSERRGLKTRSGLDKETSSRPL
ncbi:drug/metabolite transporter (DMT)-like permease [Paenibacillus rhizosphaerae]|uniref:Drug/metabolite transporter (DMT)-like permease n=1 Tax=Paenibacillus rhizosphaerae TaxID=297318 RepID=A0A839TIG2_9BACL|nr:DMT family transporter [Paenibacillus rhizosphaerae]MBB3126606.1 drug/metabolite transporter (DMT)-like permease [Paenibacillus rhizosphaerae]